MKRYLLFGFAGYYPAGGWSDFVGAFDTAEEAKDASGREDMYQVVDSTTGVLIWEKWDDKKGWVAPKKGG